MEVVSFRPCLPLSEFEPCGTQVNMIDLEVMDEELCPIRFSSSNFNMGA
jgi:hypothetical protein